MPVCTNDDMIYASYAHERTGTRYHPEGRTRPSESGQPVGVLVNRTHFHRRVARMVTEKVFRQCMGAEWSGHGQRGAHRACVSSRDVRASTIVNNGN